MKHELNLAGITALMNEPIKATLSFLDFPHIRIERLHHDNGRPFFIGVLSLDLEDHINIEMAGATGFLEALAITAYHQQLTATPLLVNDDLLSEINKLPHPQRTNPFIDRHGNEITKEMMSKDYRKQVDYTFAEKRMAELEEARLLAKEKENPNAMTQATMGKAKLLGLDKQVIDHTSSDDSLKPQTQLTEGEFREIALELLATV